MLIRCPNCDTAYHVGEDQLRDSGGQAVCCRCNEVFEAEIYKIPDDTELISNTLHDAKIDADEWQPDASLFDNIDEEEDMDVEDIEISSLIEESMAQGELPVSNELEAVLKDKSFVDEQSDIKKNNQLKKDKATVIEIKNNDDETRYGDTHFSQTANEKIENKAQSEIKESAKHEDSIFNKLSDSQLQDTVKKAVLPEKKQTTVDQQLKSTLVDSKKLQKKQAINENNAPKIPKNNTQSNDINFNDVDATALDNDSFTNPSTDDLEALSDLNGNNSGYALDSFSDEIPLNSNKKPNEDFNFSVDNEPKSSKKSSNKESPKVLKQKTERTSTNHEINELGDLLDTITKEVVQKDTNFQTDEEFSDLLDNMDSQGLLDEDSALTEEKNSDLSYLTETIEEEDGNINPASIIEPVAGQTDRSIESNSYFAASNEIAIDTIRPLRRYRRKYWATKIFSFILMLLLITQFIWFTQKDIIKYPLGYQIFEKSCAVIGCKVAEKVDLDKIKIIKQSFKAHPSIPHALELKIAVQNKATFKQPYPRLKIILLNSHQTEISQRFFNKAEYLPQKTTGLMPINQAVVFSLIIEEKGRRATTFKVDFY